MPGVPASGGGFSPGQSQVSTQDQEKVGVFLSACQKLSRPLVDKEWLSELYTELLFALVHQLQVTLTCNARG